MNQHHVQLPLDEEQFRRLSAESRRRRISMVELIAEAVNRAFPPESAQRHVAIGALLSAEPAPVPSDPRDIRREDS